MKLNLLNTSVISAQRLVNFRRHGNAGIVYTAISICSDETFMLEDLSSYKPSVSLQAAANLWNWLILIDVWWETTPKEADEGC